MKQPYRSLYIHVPFCQGGKCDYCAFASQGDSTLAEREAYLCHLEEEFRRYEGECEPLRSVFLGGGTPSALSSAELARLLSSVREHFSLLPDCEWSCEANPDSLDSERLDALLSGGVNRLSLGVQAFDPALRAAIGRRGSLERLPALVSEARARGLASLNLDLIYCIPGENASQWREELRRALSLSPDHLSCYSLMVQEGTALARRLPEHYQEDEELFWECWQENDRILGGAGLMRYEIANFAREGKRCRHNWEIWHGQTYLGCGPAAVSFDGADRRDNPPRLSDWLRDAPPQVDSLPEEARRREILAFGMRTVEGWSAGELREATGLSLEDDVLTLPECRALLQEGLLAWRDGRLSPTPEGLLLDDRVVGDLLA